MEIDIERLTRPDADKVRPPLLFQTMARELDEALHNLWPEADSRVDVLTASMNYSLGQAGKYARGQLVFLAARAWQVDWRKAMDCACAIEMIHTASLIIDDLPAMDDAGLRRGIAANHVKFGEATAILAGIGLISEAFRVLASAPDMSAEQRNDAVAALAAAVGPEGMTGGQQRDLQGAATDQAGIQMTHAMKTGALFSVAAELGAIAAGVQGPGRWFMRDFGMLLGRAFQEFDDLIDRHSSNDVAGKDTGKDVGKPTLVRLLGRDAAEAHALGLVQTSLECLSATGADRADLQDYVVLLTATLRAKLQNGGEPT